MSSDSVTSVAIYVWQNKDYWTQTRDGKVYFSQFDRDCECSSTTIDESIHTKHQDNELYYKLLPRLLDTDIKLKNILDKYDPSIVADISLADDDDYNKHEIYKYYRNHCRQESSHDDYYEFCLFGDILYNIFHNSMVYDHYVDLLTNYITQSYNYTIDTPFGKLNETCSFVSHLIYLEFSNICYDNGIVVRKYPYQIDTFDCSYIVIMNALNFVMKCNLIDVECFKLRRSFEKIIIILDKALTKDTDQTRRLVDMRTAFVNTLAVKP